MQIPIFLYLIHIHCLIKFKLYCTQAPNLNRRNKTVCSFLDISVTICNTPELVNSLELNSFALCNHISDLVLYSELMLSTFLNVYSLQVLILLDWWLFPKGLYLFSLLPLKFFTFGAGERCRVLKRKKNLHHFFSFCTIFFLFWNLLNACTIYY